jgi:hypothetical protein
MPKYRKNRTHKLKGGGGKAKRLCNSKAEVIELGPGIKITTSLGLFFRDIIISHKSEILRGEFEKFNSKYNEVRENFWKTYVFNNDPRDSENAKIIDFLIESRAVSTIPGHPTFDGRPVRHFLAETPLSFFVGYYVPNPKWYRKVNLKNIEELQNDLKLLESVTKQACDRIDTILKSMTPPESIYTTVVDAGDLEKIIDSGNSLYEASNIKKWTNMDYNDPVPFYIMITKNGGKYYLTRSFFFVDHEYDELFEYDPIFKQVGKFLGSSVNIIIGGTELDGTLLSAKERKEYYDYLKKGDPVVYETITKIDGKRPLHDAEIFKLKGTRVPTSVSKPVLTVSGTSGLNVRPKRPFTVSTTRGANIPPNLTNAAAGAGSAIPLPAPAPTPSPAPAPVAYNPFNNLNNGDATAGVPLTNNLLRRKTLRNRKYWSAENIERARLDASRRAIPLTANLLTSGRYAHINPPILPENDWNAPASIPITADLVSAAGTGDRVPRATRRTRRSRK